MLLSVIIPAYNEIETIDKIIQKVQEVEIEKEIIIIDDDSTDGTREFFKGIVNTDNIKVVFQNKNQGKGSAINRGLKEIKGDVIIIQDADLEYDPRDYLKMIRPIEEGYADVVYGSRFKGGNRHSILFFWHTLGNKFLTFLSNICSNLNLSDMETCYKMLKSEVAKKIELEEKRFGIEPEITAKLAKVNVGIYEVGISYHGRKFTEGKKIGWRDGFETMYCILKYNLIK